MTTKTELYPSYVALCDRVEKLDPEAAKYMREEAPKTERFNGGPEYAGICYLEMVFKFSETPQGCEFWWKLVDRLDLGEDKTPCA